MLALVPEFKDSEVEEVVALWALHDLLLLDDPLPIFLRCDVLESHGFEHNGVRLIGLPTFPQLHRVLVFLHD